MARKPMGTSFIVTEDVELRAQVTQQTGQGHLTVTVNVIDGDVSGAVLTFSVDGDPGENNVKDLASGERVWTLNARPQFLDIDVTGFTGGGSFMIAVS